MPKKKKHSPHRSSSKNDRLKNNLSRTLLQYVQGKRYEPVTPEALAEELSIAPVHTELFHSLIEELVAQKELSLTRGCVTKPNAETQLATGTISVHPKGFGFVKVGDGPDVFI